MSAIIRREVFAGALEGYCLPGGEFVVALTESAVLTGKANLADPADPLIRRRVESPEPLRYPVLAPAGARIAAQAQPEHSRATWEYVEADGRWFDRGGNSGVRPCVYLPDGTLVIERGGDGHPVDGWAGTGLDGQPVRIVPFDPMRDIHEYTELGPFLIGQSSIDGIELQFDGKRYQVEPGDVHTIWAVLGPDGVLAVATRKLAQNETVLLWLDVNAIAELPPAPVAKPTKPPIDPPIDPPKEPTVPAFPFPEGFDPRPLLESLRSQFPTPLGARHAEFLVKAARTVGHGAGLLKKDGGTHIMLPNGVNVSQDWMVFQNGSGVDFLGDGEGAATVGWGEAQDNPGTLVPVEGLFVDDPGGDPGGGDPGPQPGDSIAKQVEFLAAQVLAQGSRLSAVERVVDGQGAQLTAGAARDADMANRLAALEKGGTGGGGGTPIPSDLAKQIAAELLKLFGKAAA